MTDDADLDGVRRLATDMRKALEIFWASGAPSCEPGCTCPLSRAVSAAVHFIECVERFDRGEFVPEGLPSFVPKS